MTKSTVKAPRVAFLLDVASTHPDPRYAMTEEASAAQALTELGLLYDVDGKGHPGCFILSPEGERMVTLLERRVGEPLAPGLGA